MPRGAPAQPVGNTALAGWGMRATRRKPTLLLRLPGALWLRLDKRSLLSLLLKEAPRSTRDAAAPSLESHAGTGVWATGQRSLGKPGPQGFGPWQKPSAGKETLAQLKSVGVARMRDPAVQAGAHLRFAQAAIKPPRTALVDTLHSA